MLEHAALRLSCEQSAAEPPSLEHVHHAAPMGRAYPTSGAQSSVKGLGAVDISAPAAQLPLYSYHLFVFPFSPAFPLSSSALLLLV